MLKTTGDSVRVRLQIPEIEQAFDYIADKFRRARSKIEHAAFSPEIPGFAQYSASYRQAVATLIDQNRVFYRYVAGVGPDTHRKSHRLHGIRRYLEQRHRSDAFDSRYSSKVVFTDAKYNGINFFIFDASELAIYIPGMEGEPGVGLFTEDSSSVSAYRSNFDGLWHRARQVDTTDDVERLQFQLTALHSALDQQDLTDRPREDRNAATELVLLACRRLPNAAGVLANRTRANKRRLVVGDEYDVQDLLQAILRSYFQHAVREDPIRKVAGTRSGRADISIDELGILIEAKYAYSAKDQKRIFREFSQDLLLYARWEHLRTLVFLIYNSRVLAEPDGLLQLAGPHEIAGRRFDVEVVLA